MERVTATELTNAWHELPNRTDAGRAYERLGRTLRAVLPQDISASGAALVDDVPTLLALNGTSLFAVSVDTERAENPVIRVRRLPLATERVSVTLTDDVAGKVPSSDNGAHVREWTFSWDSGDALRLTSVLKVYDGWGDASQSAEVFARALAAALGWTLPDDAR